MASKGSKGPSDNKKSKEDKEAEMANNTAQLMAQAKENMKRVLRMNFGNALTFGQLPKPKPSGGTSGMSRGGITSTDFEQEDLQRKGPAKVWKPSTLTKNLQPDQMMESGSPVKLKAAFKFGSFGVSGIQQGFQNFRPLTQMHDGPEEHEHQLESGLIEGGFKDPTDVELKDWMNKSKDVGSTLVKQGGKQNTELDAYDSGRGVLSGRQALKKMEPKFRKKITSNAGSLAAKMMAYRNQGNELFLSSEFHGAIDAFTAAWTQYKESLGDNEERPRELDNLMTQILQNRALAYRRVGAKDKAMQDDKYIKDVFQKPLTSSGSGMFGGLKHRQNKSALGTQSSYRDQNDSQMTGVTDIDSSYFVGPPRGVSAFASNNVLAQPPRSQTPLPQTVLRTHLGHDFRSQKQIFLAKSKDAQQIKDFIPFNTRVADPINYVQNQKYRFTKQLHAFTQDLTLKNGDEVFSPQSVTDKVTTNKSVLSVGEDGAGGFSMLRKQSYIDEMSTNKYDGDLRNTYGKVLQQQLDEKKNRPFITKSGAEAWHANIKFQDNLEEIRKQADQSIKDASTKLNPYFQNEDMRFAHGKNIFGHQDKVPFETRTRRRVKVINTLAIKSRVRNIKEDVGIISYMKNNNLSGQNQKAESMIADFQNVTSIHPRLEQRQVSTKRTDTSEKYVMPEVNDESKSVVAGLVIDNTVVSALDVKSDDVVPETGEVLSAPPAELIIDIQSEQQEKKEIDQTTPIIEIAKKEPLTKVVVEKKEIKEINSALLSPAHQKESKNSSVPSTTKKLNAASGALESGVSRPTIVSKETTSSAANKGKGTYMDADFWYHKGVILNEKETSSDKSALDCYKQAYKLDKNHIPSLFNLGCSYLKLKLYEDGLIWFKKCVKVNKEWANAHFGKALCSIRLKLHAKAVKHIERAVEFTLLNGDQVTNQQQYTRALCHRNNGNYDQAQIEYEKVMKDEHSIYDFRDMLEQMNDLKMRAVQNDDNFNVEWRIDLFSFMNRSNLVPDYKPDHQINLWPYYDKYEGWKTDYVPQVLSLLYKIPFFDRFDIDTVRLLLEKVTFRRVEKRSCLFLQKEEVAIVVSGQLYLFQHTEDVSCPQIAGILNGGDIIGFDEIDNNLSNDEHSWICAHHQADIFVLSKEYMKYVWDKMKKFDNSVLVDLFQNNPNFRKISEQSLWKLGQDMVQIREYNAGEVICHQDVKSMFNLTNMKSTQMVRKLNGKSNEYAKVVNQHGRDYDPPISRQWDHVTKANRLVEKQKQLNKQAEKAKKGIHDQSEDTLQQNNEMKNSSKTLNNIPSKDIKKNIQSVIDDSKEALKCLAPDARKIQEKKDVRELLVDSKINKDMKNVVIDQKQMIDNAIQLLKLNQDKLEQYKKEKRALPEQSDGLYIVIDGGVSVINQHDEHTLKRLEPFEAFGIGRFLSCSGYSFFGDLVADGKPGDKVICLFVPSSSFHKIPFHDWYRVREMTYKNKYLDRLVNECKERYWTTVLRFRQIADGKR